MSKRIYTCDFNVQPSAFEAGYFGVSKTTKLPTGDNLTQIVVEHAFKPYRFESEVIENPITPLPQYAYPLRGLSVTGMFFGMKNGFFQPYCDIVVLAFLPESALDMSFKDEAAESLRVGIGLQIMVQVRNNEPFAQSVRMRLIGDETIEAPFEACPKCGFEDRRLNHSCPHALQCSGLYAEPCDLCEAAVKQRAEFIAAVEKRELEKKLAKESK